ncbi:unnamed protein product [Didymodactylos carnosus]|uniref:Uncharacterized protein n=1 Tax=Didymodactylos carnosus TaxID=1234261 RepID=A0A813TJG2_9BILA|nr:unnamed protein product [Didymodactylos carnosus]CAF0815014.1 unnamed protein product [Didymodactylos carnosus]CAF3595568.1 unnamed protein product [Didymodactylos carnosus]CAF3599015.1 unnamed protein product [Didymodactylos carnosus]
MSCGAYSNHYATDLTQLIQNVVRRSPNYFESSDAAYSDIQLNLELFNKFAEANALDDALIRRREVCIMNNKIVDQIDRFQSIDEMLEKFDMLYDSYEDILSTLKGYNEELSDFIFSGVAVESLYDLVRRYSRFSKSNEIEECTDANKCLFLKLRSIDTFMSDLTYYVHYVEKHGQQVVLTKLHYALSENAPNVLENVHMNVIDNDISNNKADWHGSCHTRRDRSATYKKLQESIEHDRCATKKQIQQPYYSFEAHGQDGVLYTIQINRFKKSEVRKSRLTRTSVMSSSSSRATINEKQQSMTTQISSKQRKEQGSIGQFRSLRQSYYDQSIPPWIEKKSGEHRSRKSTKHSTNRSSINAIVKSRMSNDLSKRQAMIIGPTTSTTVHSEVLTSNNKHIIQTLSITDPILVSQALTKSRLVIKTLLDDFSAKNVQRLLSVDEYPDLNITDMIKTST